MSEPTEAPPKPAPRGPRAAFIPAAVLVPLVETITSQLNEPNQRLIRRIVITVGVDRAHALLQQTLAIEAQGGQMTLDGTRRKTSGGVFISLARAQATSDQERKRMLDYGNKIKQGQDTDAPPAGTPHQQEQKATLPPLPPVQTPTWDEVKQLVAQALQAAGDAKTVKLTLSGRPGKVIQQPSCVVIAMQGKAPPTLPRGLPTPPANSAVTWAVFIATKQWNAVKDSITSNPEDTLLVEGYPLIDPKSHACVVLVTSCKSVLQERVQREAKKNG